MCYKCYELIILQINKSMLIGPYFAVFFFLHSLVILTGRFQYYYK